MSRESHDMSGGLGDLSMSGTAPDAALLRMAQMVVKDYKDRYLAFLDGLAQQDQRLKNELETYRQDLASGLHKQKKKDDRAADGYAGDEVVPSSADGDSGLEGDED